MEAEKIIALMEGYAAGTLSEEDEIAFFQWYSEAGIEEFHRIYAQCNLQPGSFTAYPEIPDHFRLQLEGSIRDHETQQQPVPLFRRSWMRWAAAILLFIHVGGYIYYLNRQSDLILTNRQTPPGDVAPGTTKAVLTLADGRRVTIDSAGEGQLAVQGQTSVQHHRGIITYNDNKGNDHAPLYNTLTTGRGEQSPPLILADGTKVWLNALSSIRFPVAFTGNERLVEITGEAFFEVASIIPTGSQKKVPFIVTIITPSGNAGEVEVLGTQFNINAYSDEPDIKTTLLEGAVRLTQNAERGTQNDKQQTTNNKHITLKPGQQAQMTSSTIGLVKDANVDQAVAWKRGLFDFNHASLQTVLRQLARWYDIDVKFEGRIPVRSFHGKITRDLTLSQVTKLLQDLEVSFRIEGKTLIVTQ